MLYSYTHMATVGVKVLRTLLLRQPLSSCDFQPMIFKSKY